MTKRDVTPRAVCMALTLAALSCGQPQAPTTPPAASPVSEPSPEPQAAASESAPPAPLVAAEPAPAELPSGPLEVRPPESEACRIREEKYSSQHDGGPRFRFGGERFARIVGAPTTLVLSQGSEAPAAVAVVDVPELVLHGLVPRAEVLLFAAKPTPVARFAWPLADTSLPLLAGESDKARVGIDVSKTFTQPKRAEESLPCKDLRLVAQKYDVRKKLTGGRKLKHMLLENGGPLSDKPGGPPVAQVKPNTDVEVRQIHGKHARILITGIGYLAMGWVERNRLRTFVGSVPGPGVGYGTGRGFLSGRGTAYYCPNEVPLHIYFKGESAKIGTLRPKAVFRRSSSKAGDLKGVSLVGLRWLVLMKGAVLALSAADYASCRPLKG